MKGTQKSTYSDPVIAALYHGIIDISKEVTKQVKLEVS